MSALKVLTFPIWFPFWLVWNMLMLLGRSLWGLFTFTLKLAILVLALFGLIVWLWW